MTNLVLNWENVILWSRKELCLDTRFQKKGIEVDHAKIETIEKLPPPSFIKGV